MTDKGKSSMQKSPSGLLRRIRRNRFWLLLYLWLAMTVPVLILVRTVPGMQATAVPLMTLAPALTAFLVCTALPVPRVNYAAALVFSLVPFLICAVQLVWFRVFGRFLTVHTLTDFPELFRHRAAARAALYSAAPEIAGAGMPLSLLITMGRKLFSFRPLKRWQQHVPMMIACVLIHLVAALCMPRSYRPPVSSLSPEPAFTGPAVSAAPEAVLLSGDRSPNRLDIDFDALAAGEAQDSIARIHRYFAGRTPSRKNSKTGLSRGCNLIQISAVISGSGQISGDNAPVLHRMVQEGILFADYHPVPGNDALLTGSISSAQVHPDRYQPLTMAQQLIAQGYSVWALHCCDGSSCGETAGLEAVGYECTLSRQNPAEAVDRWTGFLEDHVPFTGWCSFDSPLTIPQLDEAVEILADRLENTLMVLSLSFEDGTGLCVLRIPGTAPETVRSPTGPSDLLPTLSNLFGLSFDTRLYMGRDVFGDSNPLVILPDGSWITDLARYDAGTCRTTSLSGLPLSPGYPEAITAEVRNRMDISAGILQEDYWRKLFP